MGETDSELAARMSDLLETGGPGYLQFCELMESLFDAGQPFSSELATVFHISNVPERCARETMRYWEQLFHLCKHLSIPVADIQLEVPFFRAPGVTIFDVGGLPWDQRRILYLSRANGVFILHSVGDPRPKCWAKLSGDYEPATRSVLQALGNLITYEYDPKTLNHLQRRFE